MDLQRIDAVTRSPLQSLLAEGLDGTNTIRAFKMQNSFVARLGSALDENTGALLCWACAQRWMGIRLDCLAGVTAVAAAIVLATLKDELGITPGFAGMLMVWAFAQSISFMVSPPLSASLCFIYFWPHASDVQMLFFTVYDHEFHRRQVENQD